MRKRLNLNWRNLLRLSFALNLCLRFRKELRGRTSTRVVTDVPLRRGTHQRAVNPHWQHPSECTASPCTPARRHSSPSTFFRREPLLNVNVGTRANANQLQRNLSACVTTTLLKHWKEGKTDSANFHTLPTRDTDYYKAKQMSRSKHTLTHPAGFFSITT
jgi:hypothetical protein